MQEQLHGRLTTLHKLKAVRDDPSKPKFSRLQADQSISRITKQLKDSGLMRMRERLIRASQAGDLTEVHKIENTMKAYEKQYAGIEKEQ